MKLHEIINEKHLVSFETFLGICEVYINPTRDELRKDMLGMRKSIRGCLVGNDCYTWDAESAPHKTVINELKLQNPITIVIELRANVIYTTETSRSYHSTPTTKEMISDHPWVKQTLDNPRIILGW